MNVAIVCPEGSSTVELPRLLDMFECAHAVEGGAGVDIGRELGESKTRLHQAPGRGRPRRADSRQIWHLSALFPPDKPTCRA